MRVLPPLFGCLAIAACAPTAGGPDGREEVSLCGGLQGLTCGAGEYCSYAPGAQCGAADQTGVCQPRPEACTMEYHPVCGCDERTYGNACAAAAEGVSVAYEGECL